MARPTNRLTDTAIKKGNWKPGLTADGNGLYLRVSPTLTKSFVFIWHRNGKRTEMGLGAYPATSLADARDKTEAARKQIAKGLSPLIERKRVDPPTVATVLDEYVKTFESSRHAAVTARWRSMFKLHGKALSKMRIDQVETQHVLAAIKPIWLTMPSTATYFRAMIERLIDYARVHDHIGTEIANPARYKGHLKQTSPCPSRRIEE